MTTVPIASSKGSDTSSDIVPLADRLRYLMWFRCAVAMVVAAFLPVAVTGPAQRSAVIASTLCWFTVTLAVSVVLWRTGRRGLSAFGLLLMLDGTYLTLVTALSGGADSVLAPLAPLHLVTVSLLASFRTGLKLALWHSLLLLLARDAIAAGLAPWAAGAALGTPAEVAGILVALWLSTLASCTFAAVNERELRRRRFDLEALAVFADGLERAFAAVEVGQLLVDAVVRQFDARRAVVVVFDPKPFAVTAPSSWQLSEVPAAPGRGSLLRPGPTRPAGTTALVTRAMARSDPWLCQALGAHRNLVVVPLVDRGRELGVLVLEHGARRGSGIEHRVVSITERAASQAGLALVKTRLLDELRDLATTDPLTGVANRRTFDLAIEQALEQAARTSRPVSLVMIDVDHFKSVNDVHGHAAGDRVLVALGDLLTRSCRTVDLVARYGGEEFVVVMPGMTGALAVDVAERLRRMVHGIDPELPVTASFGVASFPADGSDRRTLGLAADQALYFAKRDGRDRVCRAPSLAVHEP